MTISLEEFHQDFFQEVMASADVDGLYAEDAFFELFCEYLADAGEFDTADRAPYCPPTAGIRVDGYAGDPAQSGGLLSLVILDFSQSPDLARLTQTDMNLIFKRLENFLNKSLDAKFRNSLEESGPAFGLADLIAARWSAISKVRLYLVSNRQLSAKVDGREAGEIDGRQLSYSVWDIERLHRFAAAGFGREDIVIDLEADYGGPIPLLPAHMGDADYKAYLAVVPGTQLATIYDRWGSRLLEQNVRVFLQARGGVNKGIRITIDTAPDMFFAYNNGIAATASSIERIIGPSGAILVTAITDLQIVKIAGAKVAPVLTKPLGNKDDLSLTSDQDSYKVGDTPVFTIVAPRDCFLTITDIDEKGVGTVLLPNAFQQDSQIRAGVPVRFPGAGAPFKFRMKDPGVETVTAVCSALPNGGDRIQHDFKKDQFTPVPNYTNAVARSIVVEAAGAPRPSAVSGVTNSGNAAAGGPREPPPEGSRASFRAAIKLQVR